MCPDFGHVYCECNVDVASCDGAWTCDDIEDLTIEAMNYYDTNYSGTISMEDDI
jgi:hypothetical protein